MVSKKIVKIISVLLLIMGLIVVGVSIFFRVTFDQESVKKQVIQLVQEKTGRELKINGKVSCLFFPLLGVKAQALTLSGLPAFNDSDFAKIGEASFKVKWLPLLFGNIVVDQLTFKELTLNLVKKGAGTNNWHDLVELNSNNAPNLNQDKSALTNFSLNLVSVESGNITWQNQSSKQEIKLKEMNLYCQDLNFSHSFVVAGSFAQLEFDTLIINQGQLKLKVNLDLEHEHYSFKNLEWSGRLSNKSQTILFDFNGSSELELDFQKAQLLINNFKMRLDNQPTWSNSAKFNGKVDLAMDLVLSGRNLSEMFKNLNGVGRLIIDQGLYEGVDIAYEISRAEAILNNQSSLPVKSLPPRTKFDHLTANFKLDHSRLKTDDILIQAVDYKITGGGQIDLNSMQMNVVCNVYGANDKNFYIPVRVAGSLTDPVITFNMAVIVQHMAKVVKNVLQQPIEKLKHNLPRELKKILPF